MPYFITWTEPTENVRKVSVQKLDEQELKKHLIDKGVHNFEVEYYEMSDDKVYLVNQFKD